MPVYTGCSGYGFRQSGVFVSRDEAQMVRVHTDLVATLVMQFVSTGYMPSNEYPRRNMGHVA